MLLSLKSNDKRIVSFLQKHLSKKALEHSPLTRDPIPMYAGNSEFIISMAKQGVNCFMEPPLIENIVILHKKQSTSTFKHIDLFKSSEQVE
jgi:hypothetical protein